MNLSNSERQSIKDFFEKLRTKNQNKLDARKASIYNELPAYKDLDDAIASISIKKGLELISNDNDTLDTLRSIIQDLSEQKRALLINNNYSPDYIEPIYSCPVCKDTGYTNNKKCNCLIRLEKAILNTGNSITNLVENVDFSLLSDSFYEGEDLEKFKTARSVSENFIKTFDRDYQNIFFYGTVGTGKTLLSLCIAKEFIEKGYYVLYYTSQDFFSEFRKTHDYSIDEDVKNSFLERVYKSDLLIVDDLGTEFGISADIVSASLFNCINKRAANKKPTIISSNLTLKEVNSRYSERISSRIIDSYRCLNITGKNIRITKKKNTNRIN